MSFLAPLDFRRNAYGADLSRFDGPAGDAALYHLLDDCLTMIEDYVGFPLRFNQQTDEEHEVLSFNLPVFPQHWPVRSIQRFDLLAWIQGGARQVWSLHVTPVEPMPRGRLPTAIGDLKVDRTDNVITAMTYAGVYGFPWAIALQQGYGNILVTYTAGYDVVGSGATMYTADTLVAAIPAPATAAFSVTPGDGSSLLAGAPVTIGAQSGTILTVVGDTATLAAPLPAAPTPGDRVTQSDGITFPAPNWLIELQRITARHVINVVNATAGGASGIGSVQFGDIKWQMPKGVELALPQDVKDSLDRHFDFATADLA